MDDKLKKLLSKYEMSNEQCRNRLYAEYTTPRTMHYHTNQITLVVLGAVLGAITTGIIFMTVTRNTCLHEDPPSDHSKS